MKSKQKSSRWVDCRAWQPGCLIDERGGACRFQHHRNGMYRYADELPHVSGTDAVLLKMMRVA